MRHLWIRYARTDTYDIVSDTMLDDLIEDGAIAQFYRPSESRWVTVGVDAVRGPGSLYTGPERRTRCTPCPYLRVVDSPADRRLSG
jgi:hypothetical protein